MCPFTNPRWIVTELGRGNAHGRGPNTGSQRPLVIWRCYAKGHMATHCPLEYDSRGGEVIRKYEFFPFEEMGQVSPGAYFRLKQLVRSEIAKSRGLIQLVPYITNTGNTVAHSERTPLIVTLQPPLNYGGETSPDGRFSVSQESPALERLNFLIKSVSRHSSSIFTIFSQSSNRVLDYAITAALSSQCNVLCIFWAKD